MSLTQPQKDSIIAKILSGDTYLTIDDVTYISRIPTRAIRHKANLLYGDIVDKCRFYDWLYKDEVTAALRAYGILKHTDANLVEIEKAIEDKKIQMFESLLQTSNLPKLRKELDMIKAKYHEMLHNQHFMDYVTKEGFGTMLMQQYIVASTLYYEETNKRVWKDEEIDGADFFFLDEVMGHIEKSRTSLDDLREIARTEPWRSIWAVSKGNPYGKSAGEWTEDQKHLALLSRMYDNIMEHPECPADNVISDDDLLDGWMAMNRRRREKERVESQINNSLGDLHKGAGELFIPVSDREQAAKIQNLNDAQGKMIIRQREAALQQRGGPIQESDLPDVKLNIQLQAQQEHKQKMKGR